MATATRIIGLKVFNCPNGEVYDVDPPFYGENQIVMMPLLEHPAVLDGQLELSAETDGGFIVVPVVSIIKDKAVMNPRVAHPYEDYESVEDIFNEEGYDIVNLHCPICGTKVEHDKCQEV